MQHPDEGTIHSWLDGALTAPEAAKIEAHVQNCAECAAMVAEARGFIAGASRILTALDNVPSGVVPLASRRKARNWPVWRAAAAIVVVALGSFVVLKDRAGRTENRMSEFSSAPTLSTQPTAAQAPSAPEISAPTKTRAEVKTAAVPPRIGRVLAPRGAAIGAVDNRVVAREQKSAAPEVVAMDAASSAPVPRDLGRRPGIGASGTLYEISPGDTVVLTEATDVRLESVVVTAAGATVQRSVATSGASAPAKSAAADTEGRVAAPRRDARSSAQLSAQPATPTTAPTAAAPRALASAPAPSATPGIVNPYNTITWVDSASGKRMSLSGRHSVRELEEIRQKIERVRAAQAGEKKTP